MFCKNCGKEISNNNDFCPGCGTRNEKGTEAVKWCETCKKEFTEERYFCDTCGGILVQADAHQEAKPSLQQPSWNTNTSNYNQVPPNP